MTWKGEGRIIYEIKGTAMQIQQSLQNTWDAEGLFHVIPGFALYHSNVNRFKLSHDYGFMITWLIWSWVVECKGV